MSLDPPFFLCQRQVSSWPISDPPNNFHGNPLMCYLADIQTNRQRQYKLLGRGYNWKQLLSGKRRMITIDTEVFECHPIISKV